MWNNLKILGQLPWYFPNEYFNQALGDVEIARILSNGEIVTNNHYIKGILPVWNDIVTSFPPLPWEETRVFQVDRKWPKGLAVPGAITFANNMDVSKPNLAYLYLIHELLHQWLGGVIAVSNDKIIHFKMEAIIDALSWFHIKRFNISLAEVFKKHYTRVCLSPTLKSHNREVLFQYKQISNNCGWDKLRKEIFYASDALLNGFRIRFNELDL